MKLTKGQQSARRRTGRAGPVWPQDTGSLLTPVMSDEVSVEPGAGLKQVTNKCAHMLSFIKRHFCLTDIWEMDICK